MTNELSNDAIAMENLVAANSQWVMIFGTKSNEGQNADYKEEEQSIDDNQFPRSRSSKTRPKTDFSPRHLILALGDNS